MSLVDKEHGLASDCFWRGCVLPGRVPMGVLSSRYTAACPRGCCPPVTRPDRPQDSTGVLRWVPEAPVSLCPRTGETSRHSAAGAARGRRLAAAAGSQGSRRVERGENRERSEINYCGEQDPFSQKYSCDVLESHFGAVTPSSLYSNMEINASI